MIELGQKIKQLRKERKLTLEALAGTRLTKGMLSLIENGKAQPSMESLHYIAEQLGIEVNVLLDNGSTKELRVLLDEVEQLCDELDIENQEMLEKIVYKIEQVLPNLTSSTYENARLLDLYGRVAYYAEKEMGDSYIQRAMSMYREIQGYNQFVRCLIHLSSREYTKHHFEKAIEILLVAKEEVVQKKHFIDEIVNLDLAYYLTAMYLAIGDADNAMKEMVVALDFSSNKKIFYRTDDLYRLMIIRKMMEGDGEQARKYLTKLDQYVLFVDNFQSTIFAGAIKAHFYNLYEKDYEKAIDFIDEFLENNKITGSLSSFAVMFDYEKSYSLMMLKRYQEALTYLDEIRIPDYYHHPYDLSGVYVTYAVRAVCLEATGRHDDAVADIREALRLMETIPETIYTDYVFEVYKQIIG